MRRSWSSEREESHLRESKLEANLSAARKANTELEVRGGVLSDLYLEKMSSCFVVSLSLLSQLLCCCLLLLLLLLLLFTAKS